MYVDSSGNQFDSYEAACYYYGADTPAQIEAEERAYALEEHEVGCVGRVNEGLQLLQRERERGSRRNRRAGGRTRPTSRARKPACV